MATPALSTQPMLVAVDAAARGRAAQALEHVQKAVERHVGAGGGDPATVAVDEAYVWTIAINVGLNHWTLTPSTCPPATLFVPPKHGDGVEALALMVEDRDLVRATKLAAHLFVPVSLVLSAAACSGLNVLLGSRELAGPFEVTDAS